MSVPTPVNKTGSASLPRDILLLPRAFLQDTVLHAFTTPSNLGLRFSILRILQH